MRAKEGMIEWNSLKPILVEIEDAAKKNETKKIYRLLNKVVPQFISQKNL